MLRELRDRRDRAAADHDAALLKYPNRQGAAFTATLEAVVEELIGVTREADEPSTDLVELAKTYRWLGDACFDLARGQEPIALQRGMLAYRRAEALHADAEAPLERAKLDFNYANTLRGLSRGEDIGLLESAEARYERAADGFTNLGFPDLKVMVEQQLRTIRPQLALVRKRNAIQGHVETIEKLQRRLEGAPVWERERIAHELAELRKKAASGDVADEFQAAIASVREQFDQHPDRLRQGDSDKLAFLQQQAPSLKKLAEEVASHNAPSNLEAASLSGMLEMLQDRLEAEKQAGHVSSHSADTLRDALTKAASLVNESGDDVFSLTERAQVARELVRQARDTLPSIDSIPPEDACTAKGRIHTVLAGLRSYLIEEIGRALPGDEGKATTDLFARAMKLEADLKDVDAESSDMEELEGGAWRLAQAVQTHARRYHLMLARPDFANAPSRQSARSVLVSGQDELMSAVRALAQQSGLQLLAENCRGDFAQDRWNQLCAASIAIFDVGVPGGPARAQVCYELGLALALGKPTVVVTRVGQDLPFNINLTPVVFDDKADTNVLRLNNGLLQALSTITWGGSGGTAAPTVQEALRWLREMYGERLQSGAARVVIDLVEREPDDAVGAYRAFDRLVGLLGFDAPKLLLPAWPAVYPSAHQPPRCFHVMPFGPDWAKSTRELARSTCRRLNWHYSRGDEAEAQRIIYGIWYEIGAASAVLVDITDHNPNVALELGLVHALGRPYRIVAQGNPESHRFPSLEKVQIHSYGDRPGFERFKGEVEALLEQAHA